MALITETQYAVYTEGSHSLMIRSVLDGEVVVAEVHLGHTLLGGTSRDDMIATIGVEPYSVIIISNRYEHEQQRLFLLPHYPVAVVISPAQDAVAVMLWTGLLNAL